MTKASGKNLDAGTVLRKRRTLRGHSLEAVHQHTRIPKNLLEALENNDLEAFPAAVYLRGFLKNYCDFLELDFKPLWEQFKLKETPPKRNALDTASPARTLPALGGDFVRRAVFAGSAVLVGCFAFWSFGRGEDPERVPARTPPAIKAPARPTYAPVVLSAENDSHLRLKIDGVLRFEGRIPKGARQDWEAREGLSLRTNTPGDIRVEFDGKEIVLLDIPTDSGGWRTISR